VALLLGAGCSEAAAVVVAVVHPVLVVVVLVLVQVRRGRVGLDSDPGGLRG
jgi:hypothetical protein